MACSVYFTEQKHQLNIYCHEVWIHLSHLDKYCPNSYQSQIIMSKQYLSNDFPITLMDISLKKPCVPSNFNINISNVRYVSLYTHERRTS